MTFPEKLAHAQRATRSVLCVGLDPDVSRLPHSLRWLAPADAVVRFCLDIVEATRDVACAYKPNLAFFEALGSAGLQALERILPHIPSDRIVIADAKRGDIGNTARMYATAFFETLGCDACTVSPYMGRDSVEPFLTAPGKAVFVLGRTSNAGAQDVQDLLVDGEPVYLHVARAVHRWGQSQPGTSGLVVGATNAKALTQLRALLPDMPFLIPGIGAQGGSISDVMQSGGAHNAPILVNSSRQILYASADTDYAEAAFNAASALRDALNAARNPENG